MEDNDFKSYDYNELKESYMIVMEVRDYIVLNDGRIVKKGADGKLVDAPEDDEFVKEIRSLLNRKQDDNEVRRIGRNIDNDIDLEI